MIVTIEADYCMGCGMCEAICPHVFRVVNGLASVEHASSLSCYVDATQTAAISCPTRAITRHS